MKSQFLTTSSLTATGLLIGAALLPAGSAFATASECGADAELVADGICEVTFTESPDSAWTPPAGITKIQALLVGAGGAAGSPTNHDGYAGGGGDVQLVELATSGAVTITVGAAEPFGQDSSDADTVVEQGSDTFTAFSGESAYVDGGDNPFGGGSGNGYVSNSWYGGGGGAGGDAGDGGAENEWSGGPGLIVNEIDPTTFDLFEQDDECLGAGGTSIWFGQDGSDMLSRNALTDCNRNVAPVGKVGVVDGQFTWQLVYADDAVNAADYVGGDAPIANTGTGGSTWSNPVISGGDWNYQEGADGKVVLRYDVALAETGFDTTGAIAASAALVAGGVALTVRRRRASN